MRPTPPLTQHTALLTLFTRPNCSLCGTAKETLAAIVRRRAVEYREVDIMEPERRGDGDGGGVGGDEGAGDKKGAGDDGGVGAKERGEWKRLYEFDVPVVSEFSLRVGLSFVAVGAGAVIRFREEDEGFGVEGRVDWSGDGEEREKERKRGRDRDREVEEVGCWRETGWRIAVELLR